MRSSSEERGNKEKIEVNFYLGKRDNYDNNPDLLIDTPISVYFREKGNNQSIVRDFIAGTQSIFHTLSRDQLNSEITFEFDVLQKYSKKSLQQMSKNSANYLQSLSIPELEDQENIFVKSGEETILVDNVLFSGKNKDGSPKTEFHINIGIENGKMTLSSREINKEKEQEIIEEKKPVQELQQKSDTPLIINTGKKLIDVQIEKSLQLHQVQRDMMLEISNADGLRLTMGGSKQENINRSVDGIIESLKISSVVMDFRPNSMKPPFSITQSQKDAIRWGVEKIEKDFYEKASLKIKQLETGTYNKR